MEGEWISYSKDGIIVSKGEYVSSRKNGLWKYWYNDGKKERKSSLLMINEAENQ